MSRQFIRLQGVRFNNPGLPVVTSTPLERFIDRLPGLRFWVEPETRFEYQGAGNGLLDRKNQYPGDDAAGLGYSLNTAINGQPTATFVKGTDGQGLTWSNISDFNFVQGGYTVFAIVKKTLAATDMTVFSLSSSGATGRMSVGVRADNNLEVRNGTAAGTGVTSSGGLWTDNAPHIVMASWDLQSGGIRLELDGSPIATSLAALPVPDLTGVTQANINRASGIGVGADASFGTLLVLDRSYAMPGYEAIKGSLYAQLAAKYGITLAT